MNRKDFRPNNKSVTISEKDREIIRNKRSEKYVVEYYDDTKSGLNKLHYRKRIFDNKNEAIEYANKKRNMKIKAYSFNNINKKEEYKPYRNVTIRKINNNEIKNKRKRFGSSSKTDIKTYKYFDVKK